MMNERKLLVVEYFKMKPLKKKDTIPSEVKAAFDFADQILIYDLQNPHDLVKDEVQKSEYLEVWEVQHKALNEEFQRLNQAIEVRVHKTDFNNKIYSIIKNVQNILFESEEALKHYQMKEIEKINKVN